MTATAHIAWRQGDPERCEELAAQAQPIFERIGDTLSLGQTLMARAIAAEWHGDLSIASSHYDRAELIFRELGNTVSLETILNNRAYAEIVAGNFEQAERRLSEIADTVRGEARLFSTVNHGLALACLDRLDDAGTRFAEALRDATGDLRSAEIEFYALEGLATVAGKRGDDLRAAQLWGASAAIREAAGFALASAEQRFHDEVAAEVRGRLGEGAFDRAWNEGRQLPREQAIELALRDA
jgi:tetratricopeptide (TPR) repeat protein